jgi:hypothetical protein
MPFESLDDLYQPSRDVAADLAYLRDVLGARVVFAIEAMGSRVAMVELAPPPPWLVLADHVDGERPILVHRVVDLAAETKALRGRGWRGDRSLELPQGPCRTFRGPGGQRFALYELTRPDFLANFEGRRDF